MMKPKSLKNNRLHSKIVNGVQLIDYDASALELPKKSGKSKFGKPKKKQ